MFKSFMAIAALACLLSACAAQEHPHKQPVIDVATYNRVLEKYGTPTLPDTTLMPEYTPDEIRTVFDRDQNMSDAVYGGKWLKVRGTLVYGPTCEGAGGMHVYYVGLENKGKRMAFLFFGARHQEKLSSLKQGQTVVIAGTYTQGEISLPKLIGCTLLSAE